jgi:hypothetical protein
MTQVSPPPDYSQRHHKINNLYSLTFGHHRLSRVWFYEECALYGDYAGVAAPHLLHSVDAPRSTLLI